MKKNLINLCVFSFGLILIAGFFITYSKITQADPGIPATVCVKASDSSPLSGAPVTYKLGGTGNFGTTNSTGCVTKNFPLGTTNLEVWTAWNHTTSAHITQNISLNPSFDFQTILLTLKLATCGTTPLNGGNPRYGIGSSYTSWWFPGGVTNSAGESKAEIFPGTYSFEMLYKATAQTQLNVVVPNANTTLTWQTTKVNITYNKQISYGGNGDSTWFTQPFTELLSGTYTFHFRNGNKVDLTYSGCDYAYNTTPTVTVSAPASWTNANQTASTTCSNTASDCDDPTYKMKTYPSDPGVCSTNYADYTLTSPQTISSHLWACGAAKDKAGDIGFSSPAEFKIDETAPSVSLIPPPIEGSYVRGIIPLAATASDSGDSGIATVVFHRASIDPTIIGSDPTAPYEASWNTNDVADGLHQIWAVAYDNAGNYATSSTVNVTVDNTAPVTTDDASTIWTSGDQTITLTPTDATSGVASTNYCVDTNATCDPSLNSGTSVSVACGTNNVCKQYVSYYSTDNAENQETKKTSVQTQIDKQAPTTSDNTDDQWHANDQTITLIPTDGSGSGVVNTTYCVDDNGTCTPDMSGTIVVVSCGSGNVCTKYVRYHSVDAVGNIENIISASNTIKIDKQVSSVGLTTLSGFTISGNYLKGSGKVVGGFAEDGTGLSGLNITTCEYTINGSTWIPATWNADHCESDTITVDNGAPYQFNTRITDNVGNTGAGTEVDYTGDNATPVTTASGYGTGWNNLNQTVTLICNDSGSGCANTYYSLDTIPAIGTSILVDTDGNHQIDFYSIDNLGNSETTQTIYVKIDKTLPTTSDDYGVKNGIWQNTSQTITLTPSDPDPSSGIAWTKYCTDTTNVCDPSSGTDYTTPVVIDTEGTTYFRYTSVDNAGNIQTTVSSTVMIDSIAPVLTKKTAVPTPTKNTSPDYTFTSAEAGTITYGGDCSSVTTSAVAGDNTIAFNTLADGTHSNCTVTVTDMALNGSLPLTITSFTIDTIAPTKPVANPVGGDYQNSILVSLSSVDVNLDAIYYTLDGSEPNASSTLYNSQTPISIVTDKTLKAIAYDKVGHTSEIMTEIYSIAPAISNESSANTQTTSFTASWDTNSSSTSRVVYDTVSHPDPVLGGAGSNYGYANSTTEDTNKVTSHSVIISGLSAGTTYYYRTVSHGSPESVGAEQSTVTSPAPPRGGGGGGGGIFFLSMASPTTQTQQTQQTGGGTQPVQTPALPTGGGTTPSPTTGGGTTGGNTGEGIIGGGTTPGPTTGGEAVALAPTNVQPTAPLANQQANTQAAAANPNPQQSYLLANLYTILTLGTKSKTVGTIFWLLVITIAVTLIIIKRKK